MGALISAPIGALGSCLGSCAGAMACAACCKACTCKCNVHPKLAQAIYCILIGLSAIASIILRSANLTIDFGASVGTDGIDTCVNTTGGACVDPNADSIFPSYSFSYQLCQGEYCKGNWAVYQISFSMMCFFVTMAFLTCMPSKGSYYLHHGFWYAKVFFIAGMIVASAFTPPDVFSYYSQVARYIAPIFILYQMVYLVDFCYWVRAPRNFRRNSGRAIPAQFSDASPPPTAQVNNVHVEADDNMECKLFGKLDCSGICSNESGMKLKKLLLSASILMYLVTFVAIGLMYAYFPSDCAFNTGATTVTLFFMLINTAISMTKCIAPHGAIFTSAGVALYTTYLSAQGMLSQAPNPRQNVTGMSADQFEAMNSDGMFQWNNQWCNPYVTDPGTASSIIAIVFATGTVAAIAWFAGLRRDKWFREQADTTQAVGVGGEAGQVKVNVAPAGEEGIEEDGAMASSYFFHHFSLAIVCVYMSMLLTNWGEHVESSVGEIQRYNVGTASSWVQLASAWACNLLYFWSLVIPKMCPGRDFGVDFDQY